MTQTAKLAILGDLLAIKLLLEDLPDDLSDVRKAQSLLKSVLEKIRAIDETSAEKRLHQIIQAFPELSAVGEG